MIIKEFESEFPYPYLGITFYPSVKINFKEILIIFNQISKDKDVKIQAFNLEKIISLNHIIIAAYHANKAFINETNLSKSIDIEFLLYLSCQRQIKLAFKEFGIEDKEMRIGISIFGIDKQEFESIKYQLETFLQVKDDETLLPNGTEIKENEILNEMALLALEK